MVDVYAISINAVMDTVDIAHCIFHSPWRCFFTVVQLSSTI